LFSPQAVRQVCEKIAVTCCTSRDAGLIRVLPPFHGVTTVPILEAAEGDLLGDATEVERRFIYAIALPASSLADERVHHVADEALKRFVLHELFVDGVSSFRRCCITLANA
jgi:hypothetical protein